MDGTWGHGNQVQQHSTCKQAVHALQAVFIKKGITEGDFPGHKNRDTLRMSIG
jgi:hypothetical protein